MTRLLGALLVAASCGALGFLKAASLKERERALRSVETTLGLLGDEICRRRTPMPELAERLSLISPAPAGAMFGRLAKSLPELPDAGFTELWERAVAESAELRLDATERAELAALGRVLGRASAEGQGEAIELCRSRFAAFGDGAAAESARGGRMWTGLGLTIGLMAAIALY